MIRSKDEFLRRFNLGQPSPTRFQHGLPLAPSAVLVALYEGGDGLEVVFTTRSRQLRNHSGEVCFPGGRPEASDNNLLHTALREFEEELGVAQHQVEVIGQLPEMPVIRRFVIRPYIGFLSQPPAWQPCPSEVEDVFTVPLHQLIAHQQHFALTLERFNWPRIWFIPWQQRLIWGATAGIVRSLSEQLQPELKHLYRPLN